MITEDCPCDPSGPSCCSEGQWRNDVFNGQGIMIHCSGVIYDGLWINGQPAVPAKKMVILGEDVIDFVQGSPATIHVQLQNEEGEIAKNENGRVLKISAGIKSVPPSKNHTASILELIEDLEEKSIQTPFGYECVKYPLMHRASGNQEQRTEIALNNQHGQAPCSVPLHLRDRKLEQELDAVQVADANDGLNEYPGTSVNEDGMSSHPLNVRVEAGCAVFRDIILGPPTAKIEHLLSLDEADKNRGKKPSGKISAEKTEKMTVSQEKIEDSRSEPITKERRIKKENLVMDTKTVRPGEYIIIVEDVTTPPFLGHTLPPAFKLIRVLPEKTKLKSSRKEVLRVPSM